MPLLTGFMLMTWDWGWLVSVKAFCEVNVEEET